MKTLIAILFLTVAAMAVPVAPAHADQNVVWGS